MTIACVGTAHAARISGRVIFAADQEPATGANVAIYDNTNTLLGGVAADGNGNFNHNAPSNATKVVISFSGHQPQTFSVSDLQNKTVELHADLPEVVVYGQQHTTTSVTTTGRGGDGCDSADNNRISPELALCSVHAYNIGEVQNPTGANRQLMKDVIALKTTVITQQMNKQYEYMDLMIRRFKTQLEKAVLTTKLQASGANK